jgi:hypothetical protein
VGFGRRSGAEIAEGCFDGWYLTMASSIRHAGSAYLQAKTG